MEGGLKCLSTLHRECTNYKNENGPGKLAREDKEKSNKDTNEKW